MNKLANLLFFGRFIDDVFGVVTASSSEEAMSIARSISYESVEIEWSVSEWNTPFLDLFVFYDPVTNKVEHKPFRKARNHLERLPWASHHPKDVKKGTFLGEMSRLATLSSQPSYYLEAIRELGLIYIARGYPIDLVNHWIREYSAVRWRARLSDPETSGNVLVLKTVFNEAWSEFDVQELGRIIEETWAVWLDRQDDFIAKANREGDFSLACFLGSGSSLLSGADGTRDLPERAWTWDSGVLRGKAEVSDRGVRQSRHVLDVRRAGFFDKQWMLSRKRTRNLFDIANTWKKSVIATADENRLSASDLDPWVT